MRGLAIVLLLFAVGANGQSGVLSGKITVDGSRNAIPSAHVVLKDTRYAAVTDLSGKFIIADIASGSYDLLITVVGFESWEQEIVIGDEEIHLDIPMKEAAILMPGVVVERSTMTGGLSKIKSIPGSAHYLGAIELDRHNHNDIHRIIRNIPGINIQEEDGFGLRPNIGMRGSGSERSSKITIMEDGVLMAPAPYAAPAAYYFPIAGRMQGIEVRKGSSQIKYGPYTTGGAINFISTRIPNQFSGRINLMGGRFNQRILHAWVGDSYKNFGFVMESYQASSDGFKVLDNGGDTGFNTEDFLVKFRVNTDADALIYQSLTFKAGISNERSDETYLGLTTGDFTETPYRRYAGSQEDVMITEHKQFSVTHAIRPFDFLDITTIAYNNEFSRNWFKLDKVQADTATGRIGISSILNDPVTYAAEYSIITGSDSPDDALYVKNNNRGYNSRGIQSTIGLNFSGERMDHDIELGIRVHKDQMDRFQWADEFRMLNGEMQITTAGVPGTESNRLETANAWASYLQYTLEFGKLNIYPGIRYENIEISRSDYGKADPERTGSDLNERTNKVDVWIPGIGIRYDLSPMVSTYLGVHKGFSPPGSKEGTNPEESINYEAGARISGKHMELQSTIFFNDYTNLLGTDLAAAGGQGTTDLFNGGEARIFGIELELFYDPFESNGSTFSLPISLVYTYTDGEFSNDFESEFEPWGNVVAGDKLPYLAPHQLGINAGLVHGKFNLNFSSKYVDKMRTRAGQGDIEPVYSTDRQFVMDISTTFNINANVNLFASVNNITDDAYMVARRPAGLRPGMPRSFMIGLKGRF